MKVLISADEIHRRVGEIAAEVNRDFAGKPFTVVGVLTGSMVLLADLIRRIEHPHKIGLIRASSYRGNTTTSGTLVINDGLLPEVSGRHLLLMDDILDTGQTITRLVDHMMERGAASVKTCVLLRKVGRQQMPFDPTYTGFSIPNEFVVGYGLDYNDDYRHLPYIGVLDGAGH